MTAVLNRIKDGYSSMKSHLTPKKILVGLALAPVVWFVASRAITNAGSYWQHMQEEQRFRFEFNQNSRIEEINCELGTIIGGDFENFNQVPEDSLVHDAIYKYCQASSENPSASLFEARKNLKEIYENGLLISRRILCDPDMFPERSNSLDYYSEFEQICCPPKTTSICPWEPYYYQ